MIRALLLCLALTAPAAAETIVIRNDGGGNVGQYIERRAKLAKAAAVRIEGKCLSACTIFTTLPNACVAPNALIGFHGTTPRIPFIQRSLDMRLGKFYRGEVRRLYEREWRFLRGPNQFHLLRGKKLAELDPLTKLCR